MRFRHSRSVLVVTLALAATSLAGAVPTYAAAARSVEKIRVPDHATITIHGRGWGHGHGMSQWGAQGAAEKGLSAKQILKFYYPHTKAGRVGGQVKVLICADGDDNTTVQNRSGLKVHALGGSTTTLPTSGKAGHATQWRLSGANGGETDVSFRNDGWHVWQTLPGDAEFTAAKPIELVTGSGTVTYRGSLQSRSPQVAERRCPSVGPRRVTVNKTTLEAYVQGVVPKEAYTSWDQAALRAQTIAARSYAAFEEADSSNPVYQLCDTSSCQVYGGKSGEVSSTNQAVAKTKGVVRTYHGKPAYTQFSSSNGGWLAKGDQPYLVDKPDPYDGTKGNLNHTWTEHRSAGAIEKAFPEIGNLKKIVVLERDGNGKWNGRIERMKLVGSKATDRVDGDTFRVALGLKSTWLDFSV